MNSKNEFNMNLFKEPVFLLPNIDFTILMNENVSEKTKKTIWKYLQLLLFSVFANGAHALRNRFARKIAFATKRGRILLFSARMVTVRRAESESGLRMFNCGRLRFDSENAREI